MQHLWIIITGLVFGVGAVLLVKAGNPGNYGFCAACHLRDVAGALGIHGAATLQYARPEVLGWVIGAFGVARLSGDFRPRGGGNAAARFALGAAMMIGALVFLGCPLRAIVRLSAGDLNGITGLAGFVAGIGAGIWFLKTGFQLGRSRVLQGTAAFTGYLIPLAAFILTAAVAVGAPFLNYSLQGPGSLHAPIAFSLVLGLVAGGLAQKTRMCLSGGIRDYLLVRDTYLLKVYALLFVSALAANVYFGYFKLGFVGQPLAHNAHVWNFIGLFVAGLAATLAGGCPLRQLILGGQGNLDALWTILGMLAGAGLAHRLNAAASPAGVTSNGQIVLGIALLVVVLIGWKYRTAFDLEEVRA